MSTLKVSTISPLGTDATKTITLGASGDTINLGSGGTITNAPAFMYRRGSNFALTQNATTQINFDTKVLDSDNTYNTSTGRFSPGDGKGGYYSFIAGIQSSANPTAAFHCGIQLRDENDNGVSSGFGMDPYLDFQSQFSVVNHKIYYVPDNYTVRVIAFVSTSGAEATHRTFFGGYRLIGV